jgi:hypothetical protein
VSRVDPHARWYLRNEVRELALLEVVRAWIARPEAEEDASGAGAQEQRQSLSRVAARRVSAHNEGDHPLRRSNRAAGVNLRAAANSDAVTVDQEMLASVPVFVF